MDGEEAELLPGSCMGVGLIGGYKEDWWKQCAPASWPVGGGAVLCYCDFF